EMEGHAWARFVDRSSANVGREIREDARAFVLRDRDITAEAERGWIIYGIERDGERLWCAEVAAAIRCATIIVQPDRDRGHTIGIWGRCEAEGAICGDRWRDAKEPWLIRAHSEIQRLPTFIVWPSMDGGGPIRESLRRRTLRQRHVCSFHERRSVVHREHLNAQ